MKSVEIADLEARLSEHLGYVRSGRSIMVLDRGRPTATIVPYEDEGLMRVRSPGAEDGRFTEVPMPPPADLGVDVVELLLRDRGTER